MIITLVLSVQSFNWDAYIGIRATTPSRLSCLIGTYATGFITCCSSETTRWEEDAVVEFLLQMSDLGQPVRMKYIPQIA